MNVSDEMDRLGIVAEDFLPFDPDDVESVKDTFFDNEVDDYEGLIDVDLVHDDDLDDWFDAGVAYGEAYAAQFDDDPSPYEGTYSED